MQETHSRHIAPIPEGKSLLLFDGVCNLCNGFVQFLIKQDPQGKFVYASLQSEVGRGYLESAGLPAGEMKTVVMIRGDRAYTRSDVPLQVCRQLGGLWSLLFVFMLVPRPVRNAIYDWIARHRYRWFGKKEACMIPTPELKERFLD